MGALHVVAQFSGDVEGGSKRIASQLSVLQRSEISNPPTYGARIVRYFSLWFLLMARVDRCTIWFSRIQVSLILNDPTLFSEWQADIEGMATRIIAMRKELFELLTNKYKTPAVGPNGWHHIVDQIGMFSFTGLNREIFFPFLPSVSRWGLTDSFLDCLHSAAQCKTLIEKAHIYLTGNGRISMAGLNTGNVDYFAKSLDAVVRGEL